MRYVLPPFDRVMIASGTAIATTAPKPIMIPIIMRFLRRCGRNDFTPTGVIYKGSLTFSTVSSAILFSALVLPFPAIPIVVA